MKVSELINKWAAQHDIYGRSGNVSFDNGRLFSYHTEIARYERNGTKTIVLISRKDYSLTTNRHCSMAYWAAIEDSKSSLLYLPVINVKTNDKFSEPTEKLLQGMYDSVSESLKELIENRRLRIEYRIWTMCDVVRDCTKIEEFLGVTSRLEEALWEINTSYRLPSYVYDLESLSNIARKLTY